MNYYREEQKKLSTGITFVNHKNLHDIPNHSPRFLRGRFSTASRSMFINSFRRLSEFKEDGDRPKNNVYLTMNSVHSIVIRICLHYCLILVLVCCTIVAPLADLGPVMNKITLTFP